MPNERRFRVYFKKDGGLIIEHPGKNYQDCPEKMPLNNDFKDLPNQILNETEIKELGITGNNLDQFFKKNKQIKQDTNWSFNLMPINLIKEQYKQRLNNRLNKLLKSTKPDTIEIIKLQSKLINLPSLSDEDIYKIALDIIEDEKIDKPTVVKKLKEKIESINENTNANQV